MNEVILYPDAQKFYIAADKAIANKIAKPKYKLHCH